MTETSQAVSTMVIHAGEPHTGGSVVMPVFLSANYLHAGTTDYHATRYVRCTNTPNHDVLATKLAALEKAEAALVTASGMAAISTALLTVLGAGDHLLAIDCPYGGTRNFVTQELPRFGIERTYIPPDDVDAWRAALRPNTRAIYLESITNPLMQVPDLEAAVAFAREHDLVSLIDNTMTSPVNFRPVEHGFDLSLHSCTKYLNGHSDLAAGAIIGRRDLVDRCHRLLNHLGGSLDPRVCYLLQRGIKTLALRVRQHNRSALAIANFLNEHEAVVRVNYPGLPGRADHERAKRLFDGFGGMLSFELSGGADAAERFIERLRIPVHAVSLGSVESLVIRPAVTAYAGVDPDERRALGVTDGLIRFSVGIEETDDLIADLTQALA